jgi:tRNA threonylcarbamoyladenosine biosynthesis protein TsaB
MWSEKTNSTTQTRSKRFIMPTLLCIETATAVCSVVVSRDGQIMAQEESHAGYDHAEKLAVFISSVMEQSGISLQEIDAVVVSGGPGSYTGLRIGVSTAKGISWSLDKPMIAVPTLQSMAAGAWSMVKEGESIGRKVLFCPMIDARRMEVYTALFDSEGKEVAPVAAVTVDESFHLAALDEHLVYFFGDGMAKCKAILAGHTNARFIDTYEISAAHLIHPAEEDFSLNRFVHTALYEPFYLKEFVAGKGSVLPVAEN